MRVYLTSIGCRLNAAEIEDLARQFSGSGHEVVAEPDCADIIVFNTCAVTAGASRSTRHRVRALHRSSPHADIALLGCWATEDGARARRLPGVRWVIPNADKASAATEVLGTSGPLAPWAPGGWGHTRAFLGVQDGCDHACTYCITQVLRGPARSTPLPDVVARVQSLVASGAQEVVLTGVCLGAYGQDLGTSDNLAALVRAILLDTDLPRLRLSSIEPWDARDELLALWENKRLCRQLHLPLQSGSDTVLKRMGRHITVAGYLDLVDAARAVQPEMALTTDLIAGFPGETEADFDATMALVERVGFSRLHVFPYSERAGTPAARLPGRVPKSVRKMRARRLRRLGKRLGAAYRERALGKILPVLWERRADASVPWRGLTDTYLTVRVDDSRDLFNQIAATQIAAVKGESLIGEIVDA